MEYNFSESNLKWIKGGIAWNIIALILTAMLNFQQAFAAGYKVGQIMFAVGFILITAGIVIGLNIYAFKYMQTEKTRRSVNIALVMSCIGLLSLNLIGTLIMILSYLRIRKNDVIEQ